MNNRRRATGSGQYRRHRGLGLCLLQAVCCLLFAGCEPSKNQQAVDSALSDYFAGNYRSAIEQLAPLAEKTDENFVLNNVRLGSAALVDYDLREAEAAFLRAYEVINSVGVNDGGRSLGAVLVDEKIKIWKGEPFERAMANFYLGLVYYIQHDYGNARGAFENALFKLRDYGDGKGDEQYRETESNFALGYLMLARCWQKLGRDDLARANFDRVIQLQPGLKDLANFEMNASANLLLMVDFGYGPQKVKSFDGAIAGFSPTPRDAGMIPQPRVIIDGNAESINNIARPPVDLLALAQERRWQSIDTIRTIKSALGTGLIAGGAIYGMSDEDRWKESLVLIGAGLLLKATSQADVRQWEMLPRTVFVIPLHVPSGKHDITIDFPNVHAIRQTWRGVIVPDQGEATYYVRMQRWNNGPYDWPPPALADVGQTVMPIETQ
jgi:tetratricopeptide (TPR) repeat protein